VNFYLVRHGEAVSEISDPRRPLSPAGRAAVNHLARLAATRAVAVSAILHSGILRAQQTAEILAEFFAPSAGVRSAAGLSPEDDPAIVAADLAEAHDSVILVGHLPHLARLTALLVTGDSERETMHFAPAMMACLARTGTGWTIAWTLEPGSDERS
jgi:phosphohistidine phosphatase